MGKVVNILGGLGIGVCLSQFPEYSQQYVQRLGGAVEELNVVVADFDASATQTNKTRAQALSAMTGTEFLDRRQADMTRTIERQESLEQSYATLKDAGAFQRLGYIHKFADPKISQGAWADFQPAIPLSFESFMLLFGGYCAGYGGTSVFGRMLRRLRGAKKRKIA